MVKRQPGRPSVTEFTGAALRFVNDDYMVFDPYYNAPLYDNYQRTKDEVIIINEWNAEGLGAQVSEYLSDIESLALHLLASRMRSRVVVDDLDSSVL